MLDYYYMNVSCDCSKEQSLALYEQLSNDRKEKADRLNNRKLAHKQIIIGAFMLNCLERYLGIPGNRIKFEYNTQGKPYVNNSGIHFNMSHSDDYVVLAVSDYPVGIDIERLRRGRLSVAGRFFCREEYEDIINAGDELEQDKSFLFYWTAKEAYVKYLGRGLSVPLNSFRVVAASPESADIMVKAGNMSDNDTYNWNEDVHILSRDLGDGYRMAVCGMKTAIKDSGKSFLSGMHVEKVCINDLL